MIEVVESFLLAEAAVPYIVRTGTCVVSNLFVGYVLGFKRYPYIFLCIELSGNTRLLDTSKHQHKHVYVRIIKKLLKKGFIITSDSIPFIELYDISKLKLNPVNLVYCNNV